MTSAFHAAIIGCCAIWALTAVATAGDNPEICVLNASGQGYLFAADAGPQRRRVARLAPGEMLCAPGLRGVVSVFEDAEEIEGCSRLMPSPGVEEMREYIDFDRCFWNSNS